MNQKIVTRFLASAILASSLTFTACKGKNDQKAEETTTPAPANEPDTSTAPVTISADETLQQGVKDATKDYPGVEATVNNGEITLSGEIERSRLQNLMQSLNTLQAKKINNNLKIK